MITLTTPPEINSVLGGNVPVAFDKLVVSDFRLFPPTKAIVGNLALTSTLNPEMATMTGTMSIRPEIAILEIAIPQLDFYRRKTLTGPQNTAAMAIVEDAQDSLESGLISLGVIDGVQAPGA